MIEPTRRAWATIDLDALRANLARVRALCPRSQIYPVIKSNAYGHGMEQAATALGDGGTAIAGFAVATLTEALILRRRQPDTPIMLLGGFVDADELTLCMEAAIEPVIHAACQLDLLERRDLSGKAGGGLCFWLEYNSGMNRVGLNGEECRRGYALLHKAGAAEIRCMSHLGYADDMDNPASREFTDEQMQRFDALHGSLEAIGRQQVPRSVAASAGILTLPQTHFEYVRPGVMLYGCSPLATRNGADLELMPVMTLHSRLIAIYGIRAGESVGYNATWVCERDSTLGVVSIGYGDGYPRSAANGTPVLVRTRSGLVPTRLVGRVSMDLITIDLTDIDGVEINDEVVLWGAGLCADEVAAHAGTISYELFCQVTPRVTFDYVGV